MIEILTITNTAIIIIFLIWELFVIITGKKRMNHLTKWMAKQEGLNKKLIESLGIIKLKTREDNTRPKERNSGN